MAHSRPLGDTADRKRKTHNKTRTGCLTCKVRRKKCDETKPACIRCTSTGRKCDGYGLLSTHTTMFQQASLCSELVVAGALDCCTDESTDSYHSSSVSTPCQIYDRSRQCPQLLIPSVPRTPNLFSSEMSDLKRHCFTHFAHQTAPQFASYFDSTLWRYHFAPSKLMHPVVLSCAAAVGAVHRRLNHGISREAFEWCDHAAKLHARAAKDLEMWKEQHQYQRNHHILFAEGETDAIMVSEMLLGLFEGFQGNWDKATTHMSYGLRPMFRQQLTRVQHENRWANTATRRRDCFQQLFHRVHCRALEEFRTPARILVSWSADASLPEIPNVFLGLEQARDYLFTEIEWILGAPFRSLQELGQEEREAARDLHEGRLRVWSAACVEMSGGLLWTPRQVRALTLLLIARDATYLLLHLSLFVDVRSDLPLMPTLVLSNGEPPDEGYTLIYTAKRLSEAVAAREELKQDLPRVKLVIQEILDKGCVFEPGRSSLGLAHTISAEHKTDHELHGRNSHQDTVCGERVSMHTPEMSSTLAIYGIAKQARDSAVAALRAIVPTHDDTECIDLTCVLGSREILLRYSCPKRQGPGMMWTQEWWRF